MSDTNEISGELSPQTEREILELLLSGIRNPRPNNKRLVGETRNAITTLLACVSSKDDVPVNLAVIGSTGTGKTEIVMAVEQTLPPEWLEINGVSLVTNFTPKALKYLCRPEWDEPCEEDEKRPPDRMAMDLSGKIIIVTDDSGDQYKFIESLKPLLSRDRQETSYYVSPTGGGKHGTHYVIRGWPVLIVLSSRANLNAETFGRFLTISPDPPPKEDILKDRAYRAQFNIKSDHSLLKKCVEYFHALKKVKVIIPFDLSTSWSLEGEQSLRHYNTFLSTIEQVTTLFQELRPTIDDETIIATKGDVEFALKLIEPLLAPMSSNVPPGVIKFFNMLKKKFLSMKPFNTRMVEHWALRKMKIGRTTFFRTHWKPLLECGLIYEVQRPKGVDQRQKYYRIRTNPIVPNLNPFSNLNFTLSSEWKEKIGSKVQDMPIDELQDILQDSYIDDITDLIS